MPPAQRTGKLIQQMERNENQKLYPIKLRNFAKSPSQRVTTNNHSSQIQMSKQNHTVPQNQQLRKNQMDSDIHSIYTDVKNPLSYSGNADILLNKVKSYKYVCCFT